MQEHTSLGSYEDHYFINFISAVSRIVKLWKEDLKAVNERAAESLADPMEYQNLFPDLGSALKAEKFIETQYKKKHPSTSFAEFKDDIYRDLIEGMKHIGFSHQVQR